MRALPNLDLSPYKYVSIHAPSRYRSEQDVVDALWPCIARDIHIVVPPDAIQDPKHWAVFGALLCIENNDARKHGRTVGELLPTFEALPKAMWCLDLAHAWQVDPTLGEAARLIDCFGDKLREIHLSRLDEFSQHGPLTFGLCDQLREMLDLDSMRDDAPILLEAEVYDAAGITAELTKAKALFD